MNDSRPRANKNRKVKRRPKRKNNFEIKVQIPCEKSSENQIPGTEIGLVKLRSENSALSTPLLVVGPYAMPENGVSGEAMLGDRCWYGSSVAVG